MMMMMIIIIIILSPPPFSPSPCVFDCELPDASAGRSMPLNELSGGEPDDFRFEIDRTIRAFGPPSDYCCQNRATTTSVTGDGTSVLSFGFLIRFFWKAKVEEKNSDASSRCNSFLQGRPTVSLYYVGELPYFSIDNAHPKLFRHSF